MDREAPSLGPWGKDKANGIAFRTAISYFLVASAYIIVSDRIAASVTGAEPEFEIIQIEKGLAFVVVTSLLLFYMIRQQTRKLISANEEKAKAQREIIRRLAIAAEWRDDETGAHVNRVAEFSYVLAKEYGLDEDTCERIRLTAPMHDVGKIGVPDDIVLFDGVFSEGQRKKMQLHTIIGAQILANGDSELLQTAQRIALSHHERWDGGGYPYHLRQEEIPIEARVTAVADVFDALLSHRRYKKAWEWDAAVKEIVVNGGAQFDPRVVEAFERSLPQLLEIWGRLKPADSLELGKRLQLAV